MAFMSVICLCGACGVVINCNPDLVPALNISGQKQAVCAACVHRWNALHPELEDFIPQITVSPLQLARRKGKQVKRASGRRRSQKIDDEGTW